MNIQTALLVEDEFHLGNSLKIALKELGIEPHWVRSLREAKKHIQNNTPDLILLDRGLPDGDGIQLCKTLRRSGFRGSIFVLTASGQIEARVEGLEAGADDYLPKPFSWEELAARIRALDRRVSTAARTAEVAEDLLWTLDEERLRLLGPNGWRQVTPLEFKLARMLIEAAGAILTRDELLKSVWGFYLVPKTRTVDHFMGRLRKNFESEPDNPIHFLTVRGAGYRFQR